MIGATTGTKLSLLIRLHPSLILGAAAVEITIPDMRKGRRRLSASGKRMEAIALMFGRSKTTRMQSKLHSCFTCSYQSIN